MNHLEESVIGSILFDDKCMSDVLNSGFNAERCSPGADDVFHVMTEMHERGEPIDAATLPHELIKAGVCDDQSHAEFLLIPCLERVPNATHANYYAKLAIEAWQGRQLQRLSRSIPSGGAPEELIARFQEELETIASASSQQSSGIIPVIDLQTQYADLKPVLVDGLLRRGETANFVSATKVGKSWSGYDLCLSVATGGAWCDRFKSTQGRVLLIDNELHKETLAHRIGKVAKAKGLAPSDYKQRFDTWPLRGGLRDIYSIRPMIQSIPRGRYSLIVVDAWYRMIPNGVSENGNSEMTQLSNCVDQYAEMTDAAWVPIHHSTKGDQSDKRVTDVGSGAGSMSRAADTHIVLREHEKPNHFVLDAALRSFPPIEPVTLRWEFPRWHVANDVAPKLATRTGMKQSKQDAEGIEKIRDALSITDEDREMWLSVSAIRRTTGMGAPRAEKLLGIMEKNAEVISQPGTYQNKPTTEYRFAKQT